MPQASLALLSFLGVALPATRTFAQVIAADDGGSTVVNAVGDRIDITGGQLSGNNTNLFQSFEQFDVTAEQTANFVTSAGVENVVGRVSGGSASTIDGTLQVSGSDANLYLMNPAGILTGPNAQLNLPGSFTATTATDIRFEEGAFQAVGENDYETITGGPETFHFADENAGAVVNSGELQVAEGQSLNLVGGTVVNTGSLSAPAGSVTMAAVEGENLVRISQGQQLLSLEVEAIPTADSMEGGVDALNAAITPTSIGEMLTGGQLSNATALVTNADGSVSLGDAVISEEGGSAIATGSLSATGTAGGNVNVLGDRVALVNAQLDVSGNTGAGLIRVGGDYKGHSSITSATRTTVDNTSALIADTADTGDGGRIIVWANDTTEYEGHLSAQGGVLNGNGGFAEVSGKRNLSFTGSVNLQAVQGDLGTLLLDPENIEITDGTPSGAPNTTTYTSSFVENLSTSSNVVFEADNNITIRNIFGNTLDIDKGSDVTFTADLDNDGVGAFSMGLGDTIRAEQGDVIITGAGITVGTIDTHSDEHDDGGDGDTRGGHVSLISTQDVIAREILTYGDTPPSQNHHSPYGGDVTIEAAGGDITIERIIDTSSEVINGRESGSAGDIVLSAFGDIKVSTANPTTQSVLIASSEAETYESGEGGLVLLTALTGEIDIAGSISTWSRASESHPGNNISDSGDAGSIFLQANGSISTGSLLASSVAEDVSGSEGNVAGFGGDIDIRSTVGDITIGQIESYSSAQNNDAAGGGSVYIQADTVTAESIDTSTRADRLARDGGDIRIEARTGVSVTGGLASYSYERLGSDSGDAGDISITGNTIETGLIEAWSTAGFNNSGAGGDVSLLQFAPGSSSVSITGGIQTYSRADNNNSGEGGDVVIEADTVTIGSTGGDAITTVSFADENAQDGGDITIRATDSLTVSGDIISYSFAADDDSRNGGNISLAASVVDVDTIGSWSIANEDAGNAGAVTITAGNELLAEGIYAYSLGGGTDADIVLVGDRINATNSEAGVIDGRSVLFQSSTPAQNINVGGTIAAPSALNILDADLASISPFTSVFIGNTNSTGNVNLSPNLYETVGSRQLINVAGAERLSGPDGIDNRFNITGAGAGELLNADVVFFNVNGLSGGNGNDTFNFVNFGTLSNGVEGGAGTDTINYELYNSNISIDTSSFSATGTSIFDGIENFVGSRFGNDVIRGSNGDDLFELTGDRTGNINNLLSFSEIEILSGRGGSNTLKLNTPIQGSPNNWLIDSNNGGVVGNVSFNKFRNLEGGVDSNRFVFSGNGQLSGAVTGNVGTDTLDYSNSLQGPVTIDLETQRATGIAAFNNIEAFIGSTGSNDRIIGSSGDDIFEVTGLGSGIINTSLTFENIERISGRQGEDTLDYGNYATPVQINLQQASATDISRFENIERIVGGLADNDQIIGFTSNDDFQITEESAGIVNGTLSFENIETLDGNTGLDRLDYSGYSGPITVDIENTSATGISRFQSIESIVGSSDRDTLQGSSGDDNILITNESSGVINNLISFAGLELVEGGAGKDTLDYSSFAGSIEVDLENSLSTGVDSFGGIESFIGSAGSSDRIRGTRNDDTFAITGEHAGEINAAISFSEIETVSGEGGSDTLDYAAYTAPVAIDLENNSATGLLGFETIENVIGSSSNNDVIRGSEANDTFEITGDSAGTVNGGLTFASIENIDGNQGQDTLDYSAYASGVMIDLATSQATGLSSFASIESVVGSSDDDILVGTVGDDTFVITGDDEGVINGGFTFARIDIIDGNQGQDTLDFSNYTSAVSIDLETSQITGLSSFADIENIVGSNNDDVVIGSAGDDLFEIVGQGSGTVNGEINFSSIEQVDGSLGFDTLDYGDSDTAITVDLENNSATGLSRFSSIELISGSRLADTDRIVGTSGNDTFEITGDRTGLVNGALAFADIEQLDGRTVNSNTLSLAQLPGNRDSQWTINGENSGIVNDTFIFNNFSTLVGSEGNNSFRIEDSGSVTTQIEGAGGTNTFDYSEYSDSFDIDFEATSSTGVAAFSNINNVVGNSSSDSVIFGDAGDDVFELTGRRSGILNGSISFSDISLLDGQAGRNTLSVTPGFTLGQMPGEAVNWLINGENSGRLGSLPFRNINNIEGGQTNDIFQFEGAGTVESINGGAGRNIVDYSNYGTSIAGSVEGARSLQIGGTSLTAIDSIVGSSQTAADTIVGSDGNDTFVITGDRTGIINNSISFSSIEQLNGALGDNTFVLDDLSENSGVNIAGGSGAANNRLRTNYANTTWQINGRNRGSVFNNGVAIADFSQIQNLENSSAIAGENTVVFQQSNAQITGAINSGLSNLTVVGDSFEIGDNGSSISGSGLLTIRPKTDGVGIALGGFNDLGPQTLDITSQEIAAIQSGFKEILVGGDEYANSISLRGDVAFNDAVLLRSRGDIDTTDGQLSATNGSISIHTDGTLRSGNLLSQNQSVSLRAGDSIQANSVIARGGEGIIAVSEMGSIRIDGKLDTSNQTGSGSDLVLTAAEAIRTGNIATIGSGRSGDVRLSSSTAGITTGGITTANGRLEEGSAGRAGSVDLNSPDSIQIDFLDARGNNNNTGSTQVSITTQAAFTASSAVPTIESNRLRQGVSLSTTGSEDGSIAIRYGNRDRIADLFLVGTSSGNGTAFSIETPQTTIINGDFFTSYSQNNVQLINNGTLPPNVSQNRVLATSPDQIVLGNLESSTDPESIEIFEEIETRNRESFELYLGISTTDKKNASLAEVQDTLGEIASNSGINPALVYVYFVPDASSTAAVGENLDVVEGDIAGPELHPDDQLEIMLITNDGEPIRRRQWGVTRSQVDTANRTLRQQATSQFSTPQQYLPPAQQLYNWILAPIAEQLQEQAINSLGFVMDTGLRTMPLATLHDGSQYLVERYELGILPSFSLVNLDNMSDTSTSKFSEANVLAMGASEFENQPDLPAVGAEVTLIGEGLGNGDVFLNEDFILSNLQTQLQKEEYDIVHLATHAVFESGDLESSYIQLWDDKLSLSNLDELKLSEEELRLIILSACNTALGDHQAEYGFAGLAVSAGSQAALASIWPVSDEGTLGFMAQFYDALESDLAPTEALRQTQIQLINGEVGVDRGVVYGPNKTVLSELPSLAESGYWDFSHPFYWSPFTMIGNPWFYDSVQP